MSRHRLTVVLSQAQGKDPRKRALEESVAAALLMEPGLDASIVPYLYDLDAEHTAQSLAGLREAARRYERPAGLGALEITITPTQDSISLDARAGTPTSACTASLSSRTPWTARRSTSSRRRLPTR